MLREWAAALWPPRGSSLGDTAVQGRTQAFGKVPGRFLSCFQSERCQCSRVGTVPSPPHAGGRRTVKRQGCQAPSAIRPASAQLWAPTGVELRVEPGPCSCSCQAPKAALNCSPNAARWQRGPHLAAPQPRGQEGAALRPQVGLGAADHRSSAGTKDPQRCAVIPGPPSVSEGQGEGPPKQTPPHV